MSAQPQETFNVRQAVRRTVAAGQFDARAVADAVADQCPVQLLRSALREALVTVATVEMPLARMVVAQDLRAALDDPKGEVNIQTISPAHTALANALRMGVFVPGLGLAEVQALDVAGCKEAAKHLRTQAETMGANAKVLDRLAYAIAKHGAKTVRELPAKVSASILRDWSA